MGVEVGEVGVCLFVWVGGSVGVEVKKGRPTHHFSGTIACIS